MMTVVHTLSFEACQVAHSGPWVAWSCSVTKDHPCQKFPLLPGKSVCLLGEYLFYKKKEAGMPLSVSGGGCLKLGVENQKSRGRLKVLTYLLQADLGAGRELGNHRHTFLPLGRLPVGGHQPPSLCR